MALKINFNDIRKANIHKKKRKKEEVKESDAVALMMLRILK